MKPVVVEIWTSRSIPKAKVRAPVSMILVGIAVRRARQLVNHGQLTHVQLSTSFPRPLHASHRALLDLECHGGTTAWGSIELIRNLQFTTTHLGVKSSQVKSSQVKILSISKNGGRASASFGGVPRGHWRPGRRRASSAHVAFLGVLSGLGFAPSRNLAPVGDPKVARPSLMKGNCVELS